MIKAIIKGMLGLLVYLVDIILTPINYVINQYLPQVNDYVTAVQEFLDLVGTFIGWILDAAMLDSLTINLLIAYLTAKILAPLAVSAVKTLVKWWEAFV